MIRDFDKLLINIQTVVISMCLLLIAFNNSCSTTEQRKVYKNKKVFGIKISLSEFDKKTDFYLEKIQKNIELDTIEIVDILRIYNTIEFYYLKKEKYNIIISFVDKKMENIVQITEADVSIGFSYYSKKYDIYFGMPRNDNSSYDIIDFKSDK